MTQPDTILPPEADSIVISVNPKAGSRSSQSRVERLVELLDQQGFQTETSTDLDRVGERANQLHEQRRLRALVAVGGDGTAAELVNRTQNGLPLTLLPSGNENLLARYLNIGKSPEDICRTIAAGHLLRIDAGKANGRIFLLMIGCGFDAEVVRRVHSRRTGHIRSRDYFKPIIESIRSYRYPELRLSWEEGRPPEKPIAEPLTSEEVVRWLFAFNLPCYGGGMQFAPQADGTDGLLDFCAFRHGSLLAGVRYAAAVFLRRHHRLADCTMARVRRLRITADEEVPYQLDGDPGGVLPVDVETIPRRLTMVVPGTQD